MITNGLHFMHMHTSLKRAEFFLPLKSRQQNEHHPLFVFINWNQIHRNHSWDKCFGIEYATININDDGINAKSLLNLEMLHFRYGIFNFCVIFILRLELLSHALSGIRRVQWKLFAFHWKLSSVFWVITWSFAADFVYNIQLLWLLTPTLSGILIVHKKIRFGYLDFIISFSEKSALFVEWLVSDTKALYWWNHFY